MGGGSGRGLNFGATFGSGQLPLRYQGERVAKPQAELRKEVRDEHKEVFPGCSTELNEAAQGKHIPDHKNYQKGKSRLSISMERAQQLTDKFGGTGRRVGKQTREVVDFGEAIGEYVDPSTGEGAATQFGTIHYGKRGCHIVPASPKQY